MIKDMLWDRRDSYSEFWSTHGWLVLFQPGETFIESEPSNDHDFLDFYSVKNFQNALS